MLKRFFSLILCVICVLSFAGCSQASPKAETSAATAAATTISTSPPFDLAAYKDAIENCTAEMYDSAVLLLNVAEYEINYWESLEKLGGTVNSEKILSSAWEWLAEKSEYTKEDIDSQYDIVTSLYKDIITTEISGAKAAEMKEIYDDYFDAYITFYNLVCAPSGSSSDFIDACNSCISTIKNCKNKLDILCS